MMQPDTRNTPPSSQTGEDGGRASPWLRKAQDAYRTSTSYVDTNFRKQWENSIRAFNSQHPTESKYNSPAYEKRSHIYRPKTRSVVRKNEAAAAAAFFSNMDTVSIAAEDQSNKAQLASSEIMKAIIQYRLAKSIPWFLFVMGGIQDAQVTGTVCANVHWEYKTRDKQEEYEDEEEIQPGDDEYPEQGQLPTGAFTMGGGDAPRVTRVTTKTRTVKTPISDKPVLDLIPVENIRIDPSANWMDPVNTSPYIIQLIPMYSMDVLEKIESGEWLDPGDGALQSARSSQTDSTRSARSKDRDDPKGSDTRAYTEIDILWVHRHIHRTPDGDVDFYCLGDLALLTDPVPLEETEFHGMRPYVMGTFVLEAHKIMACGIPQLNQGLQDESNEIANQRLDNVKFAMNKRFFAKRGKNVDTTSLVRNVPGSVVMMDDPTNDVREISFPDVTQSSYEEQNRIDRDTDELMGNFNPAALIAQGGSNAPARNMAMTQSQNGTLVEYGIRTFVETFIQPVLRLLIKCEQHYETDQVVLALAGKNAQLAQRYGVDQVTDELLNQELTLTVSVGMGATDPTQKLQKFLTAMNSFAGILKQQVPGMNAIEVGKEIFGHLGYSNASRFFTIDDPNVAQLQKQLQMAQQQIQELTGKVKEKQTAQMVGYKKTQETNQTKVAVANIQEAAANKRALATHIVSIMSEANKPQGAKK
jgi:hypothetical protein